jgi:hypothetical protein
MKQRTAERDLVEQPGTVVVIPAWLETPLESPAGIPVLQRTEQHCLEQLIFIHAVRGAVNFSGSLAHFSSFGRVSGS